MHLTMWGLVKQQSKDATAASSEFLQAYRGVLGSFTAGLLDEVVLADTAVHFGAELLARAWGPFAQSGPLAGLGPESMASRETTALALAALRAPAQWASANFA